MSIEQVKEVADAVLYEGYLLYPYRHSAIKNRQRWTFGVVYPREYSQANGEIDPWMMRTECLVAGQDRTALDITVRFLHLLVRTVRHTRVADPDIPSPAQPQEMSGEWNRVDPEPWEEGTEREVNALELTIGDLVARPRHIPVEFPGGCFVEPQAGTPEKEIVREQLPVTGSIAIAAEPVAEGSAAPDNFASTGTRLFKLSIQIENTTPVTGEVTSQRAAVLLQSFVSTHTILQVHQGAFISLLDPPEELSAVVQGCRNLNTWPVLAGNEGEYDRMLSSPIILYDYPRISPESAGALFDGTEIDEILTLRIMTLTDEEKQEMRQGDERAREILERTEALTPEQMMKLHGVVHSLRSLEEGRKDE